MDLPKQFLENMKDLLGEDYDKYLCAVNSPSVSGMRVNPLKVINRENILKELGVTDKVSYWQNGYIIKSSKIGKHPYHIAGLVYVQEPSSMLAVAASGLSEEKDKQNLAVLDLCAAPGGKSGQIAELLAGDGVLVSNEIEKTRAKILQSNIERMGYTNVIVTCVSPTMLSGSLTGLFDYIFVDAPCGGEGMFRKDPATISEWKNERIESNGERQKQILSEAYKMLKPRGKVIYSTCTFSKIENEDVVDWFTKTYNLNYILPNQSVQASTTYINNPACRRFYPHIANGEGQFVCVMQKGEEEINYPRAKKLNKLGNSEIKLASEFLDSFNLKDAAYFTKIGENICLINDNLQKMLAYMQYLPVINAGITLGSVSKDRFVPHNNVFTALGSYSKNKYDYNLQSVEVYKYLHGEELDNSKSVKKGYGVITCDGYALGGVKIVENRLKNLLPKGLRI